MGKATLLRIKKSHFFRWILAFLMIFVGTRHFIDPTAFVRIVPSYLPYPLALVYVSGFFEILGGAGLLNRYTRRIAAWGLIALYVAVFPANVHMAIHQIPFGATPTPPILLWLRLPLQFLVIAWAWKYTGKTKEV